MGKEQFLTHAELSFHARHARYAWAEATILYPGTRNHVPTAAAAGAYKLAAMNGKYAPTVRA